MKSLQLPPGRVRNAFLVLSLMGALAALVLSSCALAQSAQKTSSGTITPTAKTPPLPAGRQVATFAGGCFWAMQTEFKQLRGVDSVVAGYAGGNVPHPSYEVVCSGMTGHAETVQIIFDPKVITYTDLLRIFFTDIDPTTLNQQGNDSGTQYRSVIFYHDVAQRDAARKVIKEITAKKLYPDPIVTEVVPYKNFYAAEDYHQDYCTHNPGQPYCANVVASEVQRFVKMNRERLKTVGVAAVP